MTELFTVLQGHQSDDECMHDLGRHAQLSTIGAAETAYGVALTAIRVALIESIKSTAVVDDLLSTARAFKWADRDQPTRLFGGSEPMIGEQLVGAIFGERLPAIVDYLANEADIGVESATEVLHVVATVTVATAIGGPDGEADLVAQIGGAAAKTQRSEPTTSGTGTGETDNAGTSSAESTSSDPASPWAADGPYTPTAAMAGASQASDGPGDNSASNGSALTEDTTPTGDAEPANSGAADTTSPKNEAKNTASDKDGELNKSIEAATGKTPTNDTEPISATTKAGNRSGAPVPVDAEIRQRQHRILLGTAAVVLISGLLFVIGNSGDDGQTEVLAATDGETEVTEGQDDVTVPDTTVADPEPTDADTADEAVDQDQASTDADQTDADQTDPETASSGEEETPVPTSNIVTYNVPMMDITDPNRGANGILSFDFNTESGEVCYRVAAANINGPYRTHIHAGSVAEKGGIVVDMGPQESGAVGCLDNPPADINAILDDLDNYYAELHDVSEEWTIRGQISEAVELSDAEQLTLTFDPDGEGAYLAIENGIAVLRGEVPDLLTATALTALYAPAGSGIIISNDLAVVEGAPLPSGRILLSDHRFLPGESEVPEIDQANQQTLETILATHEGWKLTAVGRTDGDGSELDNLELSLRRAKTLRTYIESLGVYDGSVLVHGAGELGLQDRQLELEFVPQD